MRRGRKPGNWIVLGALWLALPFAAQARTVACNTAAAGSDDPGPSGLGNVFSWLVVDIDYVDQIH